jgi:hypothetical protein
MSMATSDVQPGASDLTPPGAGAITWLNIPLTLGGPKTPIVVTASPSLSGITLADPCPTSRLPLSSTALTSGFTLAGTTLVCDQDVAGPARLSAVPCHV